MRGTECRCGGGKYDYNSTCYTTCPAGTYPDTLTMNCLLCTVTNEFCLVCGPGLTEVLGKCVCPDGKILSNNVCVDPVA